MGKVKTTWLLPGHSGRACNHEDIYTKQDKKTNKVYSVKLCNPNTNWNEKQLNHRTKFGMLSAGINTWIKENRTSNSEDYQKLVRQFERQTKYSTIRGLVFGKGYASIDDKGNVVIDVNKNSKTTGSSSTPSGGSSGSGGGSGVGGDL